MKPVYGQDARVADFVQNHAPHAEDGFEKYVAIGIEDHGELVAGVVYDDWHPRSGNIRVGIASTTPRWATRSTLFAIFAYPFLQLKARRLTAYTGKSMANVRAFLERLGFVQEGVVREGFWDDDIVIYGMLSDECRWVRGMGHERFSDPAPGAGPQSNGVRADPLEHRYSSCECAAESG